MVFLVGLNLLFYLNGGLFDMTCIVGIIDRKDKEIIIGADSAGSSGSDVRIRKDVKVF